MTRRYCRQNCPAKSVVCNAADKQWQLRAMYGRRARWARTQLPSVLELTPNYALASLRKTARPVRCSWAGYKIGVLPAGFYGTGRMLPADCGKGLLVAWAHRITAPTSYAAAHTQGPQPDYTTVCKESTRQAPLAVLSGVCAMRRDRGGALPRRDGRHTKPGLFPVPAKKPCPYPGSLNVGQARRRLSKLQSRQL